MSVRKNVLMNELTNSVFVISCLHSIACLQPMRNDESSVQCYSTWMNSLIKRKSNEAFTQIKLTGFDNSYERNSTPESPLIYEQHLDNKINTTSINNSNFRAHSHNTSNMRILFSICAYYSQYMCIQYLWIHVYSVFANSAAGNGDAEGART